MTSLSKHQRARSAAESIEALASAELVDWFVWDNLAMAAYERADCDRQDAIAMLALAIRRLAEADEAELAGGPLSLV